MKIVSYGETLRRAVATLRGATPTPSLDAQLLLAHAALRDRAWLLGHAREPVSRELTATFAAFTERRLKGEPVAYIVGSAGFFGREFIVGPDVLVPRPETEHIVEAACAAVRLQRNPRVADVGTGSGAIAVTLALELRSVPVYATEISAAALAVARNNAIRHGVADRVVFLEGNLAEPLEPHLPFSCVVANLPYVRTAEVPIIPHPVGFEPRVAVDGGPDGLALYRRLLDQLPPLLAPGASCFFEAAPDTIEPLSELVERALRGAHIEIGEDYGGLERFIAVTVPG
ncbi:MAG TPA: peptide chain release factor N(5)-glutamine methyltransferase [Candidatus Acidoferrales bacterium]|nr:peptide chain release factor N(5)-glutamine methyltransferase [Candidatus Acidoferrales bacterium]